MKVLYMQKNDEIGAKLHVQVHPVLTLACTDELYPLRAPDVIFLQKIVSGIRALVVAAQKYRQ